MISIFIPVYNGTQYLARTLDSILEQTYSDFEILCVDDTSTDESLALLNVYAEHDSRIRVFCKPNGGSVPPSWKYIIPHLRGDFTFYMSQDDLLKSDTLENLVRRQQETGAEAIIPHEIHYIDGLPLDKMHHLKGIKGDITPVISGKEAFRLMIDYSISGRALWPTAVIRNIGIRTDTFNADELAQRQWILNCEKVAFSDAVFLYCRNNPESITERFSAKLLEDALTYAFLFQLVEREFADDKLFLKKLGGGYFYYLYQRMINYQQRKGVFTTKECKRIESCFYEAYTILRRWSTMENWKFRVGSVHYALMRGVVFYKCYQYKKKGILLPYDLI